MFVGGEEGIEDLLPQISSVKSQDVWRKGKPHWWTSSKTPDAVFGLTHIFDIEAITVLVNASSEQVDFQPEIAVSQGNSLFYVGEKSTFGDKVILPAKSGVVVSHSLPKRS